jgi:hypothetical protein
MTPVETRNAFSKSCILAARNLQLMMHITGFEHMDLHIICGHVDVNTARNVAPNRWLEPHLGAVSLSRCKAPRQTGTAKTSLEHASCVSLRELI